MWYTFPMESIKTYFKNNAAATTVGVALILAVVVGGIFYVSMTAAGNTLTVTGSARLAVTADNVIWRSSISQNVGAADLKTGYANIAHDMAAVRSFMQAKGIPDSAIIVSAVTVMEDYSQNGGPKRYTLRQTIEVNSGEVQKVTDIAKNVNELVATGAFFQTDSLEYYYSKLNDVRVNLLTDAVADAKARAQAMAKSSGSRVGKLVSASSGVVQVLSKGSVDVSDYGSYDTSKIDKEIMVTVRATFSVK